MKINSALFNLYEKHWENFVRHGRTTAPIPTNPMMLSFDEAAYASSTLRVMICGQETKGWDVIGVTPQEGMETYNQFFIRRNFYRGYGRSSYWKAFRFFEREFPKLFKTDKIQFIYQNISKVGRADDAGITDSIRKLEREYFPVFAEEMRILNPDIVIFLTGDRDQDIRFHFPDVEFSQAGDESDLRKQAWVTSESLPCVSMRLYHPSHYSGWTRKLKAEYLRLINEKRGGEPQR